MIYSFVNLIVNEKKYNRLYNEYVYTFSSCKILKQTVKMYVNNFIHTWHCQNKGKI